MTLWAVVPAKSFDRAKTRLTDLRPAERADLARSMFGHVLATLAACPGVDRVLVAAGGDDVARAARERGADVLSDAPATGPGLGAVIDAALAGVDECGGDRAIVIMADLPRLTGADLTRVIAALADRDVVIAPDRHGGGTNALGLRPALAMATCFGHPDSAVRHRDRARARGLSHVLVHSPGLAFDVDLPADVAELVESA